MTVPLSELTQAYLPYDWSRCFEVTNMDEARAGTNCVGLARLAIGPEALPADAHCLELARNRVLFEDVSQSELQPLDLFWFGPNGRDLDRFEPDYDENRWLKNWQQSPVSHVAIFTGVYDPETGDPLLLHASQESGQTAVWLLSEFKAYARYEEVKRISRFVGMRAVSEV